MNIFTIFFFWTKLQPVVISYTYVSLLQNAPNCTVFKLFSGEHAPEPPPPPPPPANAWKPHFLKLI